MCENFALHFIPDFAFDFKSDTSKFCLVIFACVISFLKDPRALILASILPAALFFIGDNIFKKLLRLNIINLFAVIIIIITWPDFKTGIEAGILITVRMNLICIIFLRIGFNIPFVPEKLRVLIIMTVRGVFILRERFYASLMSLRLRAKNLRGLLKFKTIAYLIASGLLRGSERSERVYQVIEMRGGFKGFNQDIKNKFNLRDVLYILIFTIYAGVIIFLNAA